jgi:hypothetical protein
VALDASSYGSVVGVTRYVKRLTVNGAFTATSSPSVADVEAFLDEQSAVLNGWLARAGYSVPVTNATGARVLARYANIGAAGLVELTQAASGYGAEGEDTRENRFLAEFKAAEAYINSGALAGLGVPQTTAGLGLAGLSVGGRTSGGERLRPIFTRTGFGNTPTAERGSKEPDYDGDL